MKRFWNRITRRRRPIGGLCYVNTGLETAKRILTCHRTCFDAITADTDYIAAVDYADAQQQLIYEEEARAIARIHRDILAIAKEEEPFDVFICYKETDADGKRTPDSVLANDLYYQLTEEGFKVFFSRITQADKKEETEEKTEAKNDGISTASLLKRVFLFLEDGDWSSVDEYCEKVLDREPENAKAYLGKLMAELHVHKQEKLADCDKPFDGRRNYQKIVRFGGAELAETLKGYTAHIAERNKQARLEKTYAAAMDKMENAKTYKDACFVLYSNQNWIRKSSTIALSKKIFTVKNPYEQMQEAIRLFSSIPGWKDSEKKIQECLNRTEELKKIEEKERKRKILMVILLIIAGILCYYPVGSMFLASLFIS